MKARSTGGHAAPERPPLQLEVGEHARIEDRGSEWPEFVYVVAARGTGWVPARYLSGDTGTVVVQQPYDTKELEVAAGETVSVVERDDLSGWWWCRNDAGEEGWVPVSALTPVDS